MSGQYDAVHDFVVQLESKAKRILRAANKEKEEQARREHLEKMFGGKSKGKGMAKTGTVLIAVDRVNKTLTGNTSNMPLTNKGLGTTKKLDYSVPKLTVMMDKTKDLQPEASSAPPKPPTAGMLSPIKKFNNSAGVGKMSMAMSQASTVQDASFAMSAGMNTSASGATAGLVATTRMSDAMSKSMSALDKPSKSLKRNNTLQKLNKSAYMSQSGTGPGTIDEILASRKTKLLQIKKKNDAAAKEREASAFDLKRDAAAALSGKLTTKARKNKKGQMEEVQGPVDWSIRGLRSKYRGENEREELWENWMAANKFSTNAFVDDKLVLPVAIVERHPMVKLFYERLGSENGVSLTRTKARLLMKRFVLDVHEVWLMNLQHLREHQPAMVLAEVDQPETADQRGFGVKARRDGPAVLRMESQIQSVSHKRAMQRAFYTTSMPAPTVKLDYEVLETPTLQAPKPLPPVIEELVVNEWIEATPASSSSGSGKPILVNIGRLLPSSDSVFQEVMWRITGLRGEDAIEISQLYDEDAVANFVSLLIETQDGIENCIPASDAIEIYKDDEEGIVLAWSVVDILVTKTVYIKQGSRGRVRISVLCEGVSDEWPDLRLSRAFWGPELLSLLGMNELRSEAFAGGLNWWKDTAREEIWMELFDRIHVVDGDEDENGDPWPKSLDLKRDGTMADRVDGALQSAAARTMGEELLRHLLVVSSPYDEGAPLSFGWSTGTDAPIPLPPPPMKPNILPVTHDWDDLQDDVEPLSLRASGAMNLTAQCPGSQANDAVGSLGLSFTYRWHPERTRPSAIFFRNPRLSSSDSVMVNMTLALDTPVMVEPSLCFGEGVVAPPRMPAEEREAYIPMLLSPPGVLLNEPLQSPIMDRMSFPCVLFNTMPTVGVDHVPLDLPSMPIGMTRHWPWRNKYGFRRKNIYTLMLPEVDLPTVVFGITKNAAQPNVTGVNARNIWHSSLAITEHINRPRAAKDYHYVIQVTKSQGANDPIAFTIAMRRGEFFDIVSLAHKEFEETYGKIQAQREILARQMALDTKIENSEVMLKIKEKELELQIQRQMQRAIEKKLRKASKSELGWRRRYRMSTLVEVQDNWERRRDDRGKWQSKC